MFLIFNIKIYMHTTKTIHTYATNTVCVGSSYLNASHLVFAISSTYGIFIDNSYAYLCDERQFFLK